MASQLARGGELKLKITDKMRRDWLMADGNGVLHIPDADRAFTLRTVPESLKWQAWSEKDGDWFFARTKRAAIDRAIRAEHKAKEKR